MKFKVLAGAVLQRAVLPAFVAATLSPKIASAQSSFQIWSAYKDLAFATSLSPVKVVPNPSGGYYVAGTNNSTMVIASYDSGGGLLWWRGFPGTASDLAVTSSGIYLVGGSHRALAGVSDITIVRYDTAGVRQWFHYAGGTQDPLEGPNVHVGTDPSGNAIVLGTKNNGAAHDISLQKFTASGTLVWDRTFGTLNNDETSGNLAVDSSGNAFIAGATGTGLASDGLIVKYSPDGNVLWSKTYDGGGIADFAHCVTTDISGNAFVGLSSTADPNDPESFSGSVIKYDSTGVQAWLATEIGGRPNAIVLTPSGSLVLFNGNSQYGVSLVSSTGQLTGFGDAIVNVSTFKRNYYDIYVDDAGSIYLGGIDFNQQSVTHKMDAAGHELWQRTYVGVPGERNETIALCRNINGGVVSASAITRPNTDTDVALSFYDPNGNSPTPPSISEYGGSIDFVEASATDSLGYTYVIGTCGANSIAKGVITRFTPSGGVSWSRTFGATGLSAANALTILPNGNVAVAGFIYNAATDLDDDVVRVYDPAGNLVWSTFFGTSPDVRMIRADTSGSLYVCCLGGPGSSMSVTKLNSTGSVLWTASRPIAAGEEDNVGFGLAVDSAGNAYIGGQILSNGLNDGVLVKFNSDGTFGWTRYLGATDSGFVSDVLIDNLGRPNAVGTVTNLGVSQAIVRRYTSSGATVWTRMLGVVGYGTTVANTSLFDTAGNLYVAGSATAGTNTDFATFKVSQDGSLLWGHVYGEADVREVATKIVVDPEDNVYTGGIIYLPSNSRDYAVVKYEPTGEIPWPFDGDVFFKGAATYDNDEHSQDLLRSLSVDAAGNIYFAGSSYGPNGSQDFHVAKFGLIDNASFLSAVNPTAIIAGQTYSVTVNMKNTTNLPWTAGDGYQLACVQGSLWGRPFVTLGASESIAPGQTKKFSFSIYAPATAGTYPLQWKMDHSGTRFGQASTLVNCPVTVRQHAARYVSQTLPTTVKAGANFTMTVTMKNVGTNTWTPAGGYQLISTDPDFNLVWGKSTVALGPSDSIGPNQQKTFSIACKAPSTPGDYVVRWRMYRSAAAFTGVFGDKSATKVITVTP